MTAVTFVAFPVSALVIWALLRTGLARRIVAAPRSDRWHGRTTPTLGGIGIFAGLLAGVAAALAADVMEPRADLLGILGGCSLLFLAGLADDIWSFGALPKLAAQLAAAGLVLGTGLSVEIVGNDVLGAALAVVWLVGMTNAFNLLDNMDGLAATLAGIACLFFALDAFAVNESVAALVLSISIGLACAGFLPFNIRPHGPALIFMGDSGSQVLGFAVAALALFSTHQVAGATVATLALPILILAVPMFDTALVTVVRLLEGRPVYQGGRDHTSHRLVYQGLTEKRAVILLAVLSAALGATALGYSVLDDGRVTALGVLITFAALVQFASFIGQVERHGTADRDGGSWLSRTFVVHRRRLVESVADAALLAASFLGAYLLVVGGEGTVNQRDLFMTAFPVVLFFRYACFVVCGLYSGVWRYAGARDAVAVAAAVGASGLMAFAFLEATRTFGDFPATIFLVDALLATVLIGASRFGERALDAVLESLSSSDERRRTVILGAGRAGRSLLRELRETQGEQVVGFVDDDRRLRRRRIQGTRVLGGTDDLETILATVQPDAVLVTIPNAPRDRLDDVVRACARAQVPCRFVRRETDLDPEVVLGGALLK